MSNLFILRDKRIINNGFQKYDPFKKGKYFKNWFVSNWESKELYFPIMVFNWVPGNSYLNLGSSNQVYR